MTKPRRCKTPPADLTCCVPCVKRRCMVRGDWNGSAEPRPPRRPPPFPPHLVLGPMNRSTTFEMGRFRSNFGEHQATLGRTTPQVCRVRTTLGQTRAKFDEKSNRNPFGAKFGQHWAECGSGQIRNSCSAASRAATGTELGTTPILTPPQFNASCCILRSCIGIVPERLRTNAGTEQDTPALDDHHLEHYSPDQNDPCAQTT